jgi:hypothetical protein
MAGVSPETCWASFKYGIIKKSETSCCIFLYELYYDARIHEHQHKTRQSDTTLFSKWSCTVLHVSILEESSLGNSYKTHLEIEACSTVRFHSLNRVVLQWCIVFFLLR